MHMLNIPVLYIQSIRKLQLKLWYKLPTLFQKVFYGIKLLHANVQCAYIVYTKYQDVSVKAVEHVEFPVYALPMHH